MVMTTTYIYDSHFHYHYYPSLLHYYYYYYYYYCYHRAGEFFSRYWKEQDYVSEQRGFSPNRMYTNILQLYDEAWPYVTFILGVISVLSWERPLRYGSSSGSSSSSSSSSPNRMYSNILQLYDEAWPYVTFLLDVISVLSWERPLR